MLRKLNSNEIKYVSGGWICDSSYEGLPFIKATWHSGPDKGKNRGVCYYGDDKNNSHYFTPYNLGGILNDPVGTWSFVSNIGSSYLFVCTNKDASSCTYKDAESPIDTM